MATKFVVWSMLHSNVSNYECHHHGIVLKKFTLGFVKCGETLLALPFTKSSSLEAG